MKNQGCVTLNWTKIILSKFDEIQVSYDQHNKIQTYPDIQTLDGWDAMAWRSLNKTISWINWVYRHHQENPKPSIWYLVLGERFIAFANAFEFLGCVPLRIPEIKVVRELNVFSSFLSNINRKNETSCFPVSASLVCFFIFEQT